MIYLFLQSITKKTCIYMFRTKLRYINITLNTNKHMLYQIKHHDENKKKTLDLSNLVFYFQF